MGVGREIHVARNESMVETKASVGPLVFTGESSHSGFLRRCENGISPKWVALVNGNLRTKACGPCSGS